MNRPSLTTMKTEARFVYAVVLFSAPVPCRPRQKPFLFSTLAAIHDSFSVMQIDYTLGHLGFSFAYTMF